MSSIIELEEDEQTKDFRNSIFFKDSLKAIFRTQYPNECRQIHDNGKQITVFIRSSQYTYRLSTLWLFQLDKPYLQMRMTFYNKNENEFLRCESDRLKFEAYILMRMINSTVVGYQFKIDSQSGVVRVQYMVSWTNFQKVFSKSENISNFIKTIFNFTRKYDELIVFIERSLVSFKPKLEDANIKAQKFRYIIKARKNIRKNLHSSMGDLFKIKQIKQNISFDNVAKVRELFMQSINWLYQSIFEESGLMNEFDKENLNKEMSSIEKNQRGVSTVKAKIVMGLLKIRQQAQSAKRAVSDEGAHAKIYFNRFRYSVVDTIYNGTIGFDEQTWKNKVKDAKGELAYKICNMESEASKNSFKNQLAILKYFKEDESPYIARYYLLIKQEWDESDRIYMSRYKKNLYNLIEHQKGISMRTKLVLAYGIIKGLCFINSKGILHRDFKPHNVLIDSNLTPKIIDFGSVAPKYGITGIRVYDQRLLYTEGFHIPYESLAPQIKAKISMEAYDKHPLFDVFGFGRTLSYLFFGTFNPPNPELVASDPHSELLQHILFIIYMCLQADPDQRPILGQLAAYIGILPDFLKQQIGKMEESSATFKQSQ